MIFDRMNQSVIAIGPDASTHKKNKHRHHHNLLTEEPPRSFAPFNSKEKESGDTGYTSPREGVSYYSYTAKKRMVVRFRSF